MAQQAHGIRWTLWLGPLAFAAVAALLGGYFGFKEATALGTVFWMGIWWIARPVHIAVTAFVPVVVNALFNLVPMQHIISQYFSEIIVLLLGADIICFSWTATGLDKRLSLRILCLLGSSLKQQIAVWLTVAALLSVILPNAVVCALLVPVAVAMLRFVGEGSVAESKIAVPILLAIAWGAGIGGVGSPLVGAVNLVAINYLVLLSGRDFIYVDWFLRFLPFLAILLVLNLLLLLHLPLPVQHLPGSRAYFKGLYAELGPMGRAEKISFAIFVIATLLAFIRPLYAALLPGLKPAYVFITFSVLCFLLKNDDGRPLLRWEEAEKHILWGVLILFAGGLALGDLVTRTGAAQKLAQCITLLPLSGGLETVGVFTAFSVLMTEISSNTAAAAITIPVVQEIVQAMGLDPVPYMLIVTAGVNSAYVLPVSIRAIPVSYGLNPSVLFKNGLLNSLASMVAIALLGYLFMCLWPGYGAI